MARTTGKLPKPLKETKPRGSGNGPNKTVAGDGGACSKQKSSLQVQKRLVAAQVQSQKLVADRRERIIRSAIAVFHRLGYHAATTADIAREAALTQSNLYNYVRTKQDVLFLVCEHLVSMYEDVLEEVSAQFDDPHARLVQSLSTIIDVMSTYSDEVQLLYNEIHALEGSDQSVITTMMSRFINRFETLIAEYEKAAGVTIKNRRLAANIMSFTPAVLALRGWDLHQHRSPDRERTVREFILEGLGIPAQPA